MNFLYNFINYRSHKEIINTDNNNISQGEFYVKTLNKELKEFGMFPGQFAV